ncbi:hypothetical protein LJC45_05545 [Alistipes sp. OttesenSCG-928-B03]|nr:hypothetical protein [Alistipes sp. OttesenSCG-928-B03]
MDDMDTYSEFESPHHVDYDALLEHVVQNDHELLYLDTYLRECFACESTI